jgi:WD40 repeat protein/tetratricopeptide (TPR) repeat protein
MAVVYKARQVSLNRIVALKMILSGAHASPLEVARFQREAEAVARLQHLNIVQVFDVGQQGGLIPYLSMEYMEGGSLAQQLTGAPVPARHAASLVEILAQAVHYAHQHGVIHRDLKPANILIGKVDAGYRSTRARLGDGRGESPVAQDEPSMQPPSSDYRLLKIADFGVAKQLDSDVAQTRSGVIIGTAPYMAPEQAAGKTNRIGPATDIYALGATLYELLTGRPPFRAETPVDTMRQVISDEPLPPSRLQPKVPRDLETICLKCLQKEIGKRYASAQALGEDLQRFLRGEPIVARPVSWSERGVKWARRRPAVAGLLGVLALVLTGSFLGMAYLWLRAENQREAARSAQLEALQEKKHADVARADAESQRDLAKNQGKSADEQRRSAVAAKEQLERQVVRFNISNGAEFLEAGDLLGSLCWFAEALKHERGGPQAEATHRVRLAAILQSCPKVLHVWSHQDGLTCAEFSADGRYVATAGWENSARVWDAVTGKGLCPPLQHGAVVRHVAFSPSRKLLATASDDKTARVWNVADGALIQSLKHSQGVWWVEFSPDGRQVVTAGQDASARVWAVATGTELHRLGHAKAVVRASFSPDGQRVLTASLDNTARVWEPATGLQTILRHDREVWDAAFSPDGREIVTASRDKTAKVWDTATDALVIVLRHEDGVAHATFSPSGDRVVTAGLDRAARVWAVPSGHLIARLEHWDSLLQAGFSPDGLRVVTASDDLTAVVWDATTGQRLGQPLRHGNRVSCASFSPEGRFVLTASHDKSARIWDPAPSLPHALDLVHDREQPFPSVRPLPVKWASFSPDGRHIVTAEEDGTARVWSASSGRAVHPPLPHRGPVLQAAFSRDGRQILTASQDWSARVWETTTGKAVLKLRPHGPVLSAAFSPDGTSVLTVTGDQEAQVWDRATGRPRYAALNLGAEKGPHNTSRRLLAPQDRPRVSTNSRARNEFWARAFIYPCQLLHAPLGSELANVAFWDDPEPAQPPQQPVAPAQLPDTPPPGTQPPGTEPPGTQPPATRPPGTQPPGGAQGGASGMFRDGGFSAPTAGAEAPRAGAARPEAGPIVLGRRQTQTTRDDRMELFRTKYFAWFSPDGRRVIAAGPDQLQVWNAASGQRVLQQPRGGPVYHAALSPDGSSVVIGSRNAAELWEIGKDAKLSKALLHTGPVFCAVFSPDGRKVVTASFDQTARVWDAASGRDLTPPLKHGGWVHEAVFSPDGNRVLTASLDHAVRVWDVATGQLLGPPMHHSGMVTHAEFSPDGHRAVISSTSGLAQVLRFPGEPEHATSELGGLAKLVSGWQIDRSGGFEPLDAQTLRGLCSDLRSNHAGHFVLTREELLAWHLREADRAEREALRWKGVMTTARAPLAFPKEQMSEGQGAGSWPVPFLVRPRPTADAVQLRGALWHLNRLIGMEADNGAYLARRAHAEFELGEFDVASEDYTKAIQLKVPDPNMRGCRGTAFARSGNWTKALEDFLDGVKQHPTDPLAWFRLHLAYAHRGERSKADAAYEKAVRFSGVLGPQWGSWWSKRAREGANRETYFEVEQWLPARPGDTVAEELPRRSGLKSEGATAAWKWRAHGYVSATFGVWRAAGFGFEKACTLNRSDREALRSAIRAQIEVMQFREAVEASSVAIATDETDWELWYLRGIARLELGAYDKAVGDFTRVIRSGAAGWGAWAERATAYAEQAQWDLAAEDFTVCLKRAASDEKLLADYALACLGRGDRKGYQDACAALVRRFGESEDPQIARLVASACAVQPTSVSSLPQQVELATTGLADAGEDAYPLHVLGAALYRAGKLDDAVQRLSDATASRQRIATRPVLLPPRNAPKRMPSDSTPARVEVSEERPAGETLQSWLIMAMAHHRLGHAADADRYLGKAGRWLDQDDQGQPTPSLAQARLSWEQRLALRMLYREAKELLAQRSPRAKE